MFDPTAGNLPTPPLEDEDGVPDRVWARSFEILGELAASVELDDEPWEEMA